MHFTIEYILAKQQGEHNKRNSNDRIF